MEPSRQRFVILRAQAGDRAALDEVLRSVQGELYGYICRLIGDVHLAEDILQETFVVLCRQLKWLRHPEFFRTWLYRVATREAMRRIGRERRRRGIPLETIAEPPSAEPWCALEPGEIADALGRIHTLPPNSRAVILLHYCAGLSLSDAATAMGVPEGTAKSRLAYGLGLLRKKAGEA